MEVQLSEQEIEKLAVKVAEYLKPFFVQHAKKNAQDEYECVRSQGKLSEVAQGCRAEGKLAQRVEALMKEFYRSRWRFCADCLSA
jgi:hypothetical protein